MSIPEHLPLIETCVSALANTKSKNIQGSTLGPDWSTVHVNSVSVGNNVSITFRTKQDALNGKDGTISDYPEIYCLLSRDGEIHHLTSPEEMNGKIRILDIIPLNSAFEEKEFDVLVSAVRSGKPVFSFDTIYKSSGNTYTIQGETIRRRVDPKDYITD
ncbi:hypothetical protein [Microbulbifer halophilus]|uniref:Uncharacterized protein n=1 Tax=Microbulbifer halophilus TaxID=453963 RepID=A0ABW5EC48_9GAMM|nr:hypothetical protein [Microbulbifer halophilus]MCW8126231.1 hypothetical protein [Microbulbifer halophilus]